jgi:maltooligosyltrehalose synthase
MGILLDVVPNHMCIADVANRWWADVLENGPSSPFARSFDIDWRPPKAELQDKVLPPFLGDQYGRVLERGELRVVHAGGGFAVEYPGGVLPLAPRTWAAVLEPALDAVRAEADATDPRRVELESIITSLGYLPRRTETAAPRLALGLGAGEAWPLGERARGDGALLLPEGAPARWRNAFTGEALEARGGALPLVSVLASFPVALLEPAAG